MIAAITGRGLRPLAANGCARRKAGALLVVSAILSAVAVSASAETLRVGKAGRDAFSFVPADIGARAGIFKKHGVDIEISSFGGDARCSRRWPPTASTSGSAPDRAWPSSSRARR